MEGAFEGKKNTDKWFPVRLVDGTDLYTPETGVAFGDLTVKYGAEGATSESTYTVTTDEWKEQGDGNYWLAIGASEFTAEGKYIVKVEAAVAYDYSFIVEIRDKTLAELIDDVVAILDDTGTSGVIVATNNDKTGYSISGTKTTLDNLNDISQAIAQAGAAAALVAARLDELLDAAKIGQPETGSFLGDMTENDGGTQRFTANALEQGPSGPSGDANILKDTTIATVVSQTEFTLSAGSNDDHAYKDQPVVFYDASENDNPSPRIATDYVAATLTLTINTAPDFTVIAGDGIKIFVSSSITAAGIGAITWAYTLTESGTGDPIADANVWVTSDIGGANVLASGITDQNGVVTFYLDAGTVYVWRQKSGWNFTNPDTETVS